MVETHGQVTPAEVAVHLGGAGVQPDSLVEVDAEHPDSNVVVTVVQVRVSPRAAQHMSHLAAPPAPHSKYAPKLQPKLVQNGARTRKWGGQPRDGLCEQNQ